MCIANLSKNKSQENQNENLKQSREKKIRKKDTFYYNSIDDSILLESVGNTSHCLIDSTDNESNEYEDIEGGFSDTQELHLSNPNENLNNNKDEIVLSLYETHLEMIKYHPFVLKTQLFFDHNKLIFSNSFR
jgi:hypothetical protein